MPSTILIERDDRVITVRLNRPDAMNALNSEVMRELVDELTPLDRDPGVCCFVLTGNDKVFAAGADIKEMKDRSYMEMFHADFFSGWDAFVRLRTPKIAAVSGYALGGGCELAMMCDMIFASQTAQFGQPEIKLGVVPGMGGSQRLTRLVGKAKAVDMILTGRNMGAEEAERAGLVARVLPVDELVPEAQAAARTIAGYSKTATIVALEQIDRSQEVGLTEGVMYERRTFHALFATEDQKEGMAAFAEKRRADFKGC